MTDAPKRRGRPPMTEEQKKAAAEARAAAKAAEATAGKKPTPKAEKPPKPEKKDGAPKRATRAAPKESDNKTTRPEDLTEDQLYALTMRHSQRISTAEALLEKAKAEVKGARDLARAELGKDALHNIKLYAELQTEAGQKKLKDMVSRSAMVARWAGMPTGHMDDLFSPDREPLETKMYEAGKRAGLKGDIAKPPHETTGEMQQKWMEGWHAGQKVLTGGFGTSKPQSFGSPPPEQKDWRREGIAAFEAGSADTPSGDVPKDFHDEWRGGYEWAKAERAKEAPQGATIEEVGEALTQEMAADEPEPQTAQSVFNRGAAARKAGIGAVIPDDVPTHFRDHWLDGWNSEDPSFWRQAGREAWQAGHNGDVPASVPAGMREEWFRGWENAKSAHEMANRPKIIA